MLPNGRVVREALLGEDRIASRLRPGTIIVDTSSSDPYGTRELGAELAALGLILLDSPVTRPEAVGDETRRITFMVAGDDNAAIDRVMPLLEAMAECDVPGRPARVRPRDEDAQQLRVRGRAGGRA